MLAVALRFGVDGRRRLAMRPLTGADERAAGGDAMALLARLALAAGGVAGDDLQRLTVADRDRALAALYRALYGPAITADARCAVCGEKYEIRFDLDALTAAREPDGSARGDPPFVAVAGGEYRLPTVADLEGGPSDVLARLFRGGHRADTALVEQALEAADPALALDLAGICPSCGARQATPFAIAPFLGAAIRRDAAFLLRETHLLARAYAWSFDAILALTRAERHGLARLVLGEAQRA